MVSKCRLTRQDQLNSYKFTKTKNNTKNINAQTAGRFPNAVFSPCRLQDIFSTLFFLLADCRAFSQRCFFSTLPDLKSGSTITGFANQPIPHLCLLLKRITDPMIEAPDYKSGAAYMSNYALPDLKSGSTIVGFANR